MLNRFVQPDSRLFPSTSASYLKRITHSIAYVLYVLAEVALVVMLLVSVADVVFRPLRVSPFIAFDIVRLVGPLVFVFGWSYTQVQKDHLRVDVIMSRLPQGVRSVIESITYVLSVFISVVMVWNSIALANELRRANEMISTTTSVPLFPVAYGIAFAIILLTIVLLIDLINTLVRRAKK